MTNLYKFYKQEENRMVQEKTRAVFYARVSTEEERQLNALEKQVAECKDAILRKGWKLVDQ